MMPRSGLVVARDHDPVSDAPPTVDDCPSCGTAVPPRAVDGVEGRPVERGSCTGCGLQLVRRRGEGWREIRG
jgi:ribosomal protein L37AE/L43A